MQATQTETPKPPLSLNSKAALAVMVLLLFELVLGILLAVTSAGWPAFALIILCLVFLGVTVWSDPRSRHGARPAWELLVVIWLTTNLAAFLVTGIWLPLTLASLLMSIAISGMLFERDRSTPPMLIGVLTTLPIPLIEFVIRPPFRAALPPFLARALPFIIVIAALILIAFLISQFTRLSLRQKLVVSFLFLSVVPIVGLRSIFDFSFRQALTDAASQNLFSAASQTATAIDGYITSNLDTVATQSTLPNFRQLLETSPDNPAFASITSDATQLIYTLQSQRTNNEYDEKFLRSYSLLNRQGIVILDTSVPQGDPNPNLGLDYSSDPFFVNPIVLGIPYASTIRAPEGMQTARIYFTHRINNAANQPIGVFVAAYDATFLQELLTISKDLAGEGSYGALFDENHIFLANANRPDLVFESVAPLPPNIFTELVSQGRLPASPDAMTSINFPELETLLANAARQPTFSIDDKTAGGTTNQVATASLTSYPWLVAFFQPEDAFLAPVNLQTRNSLIFAGAIAAVAVLVALVASNQLASPILRLTEAAEEVSAGNLYAEANVTVRDEVGTLAATFNNMTRQLRETLTNLESMVTERTARLEATNEVGRVASSILNRDELVSRIVNLVTDRFGFYYAAIFLVDEDDRWAVLKDATGEAGEELKQRKHRLEIGGRSMVGTAISSRTARIALDVGEEPVRFDNPLLPRTRSEIALPLIVGDDVLGALDVQSTEEAAFNEQDIDTLQTLANQVAISIENANLFERTQQIAERQLAMNDFQSRLQRSPDVEQILSTTVIELAGLLDAQEVTIQLAADTDKKQASNGTA